MLIFTGVGIMMVVRNIPNGLASVLVMVVINTLAVIFLIVATNTKRKLRAVVCAIIVICWIVYAFIGSIASPNEDATIFATIYAVTGVLAIVFGILRQKTQKGS